MSPEIILVTGLVVLLIYSAWKLAQFKLNINKYNIGNLWKTMEGEIILIEHIEAPNHPFPLKCCIKTDTKDKDYICNYNTKGEREFIYIALDEYKFAKHIGTKESNPEYWL